MSFKNYGNGHLVLLCGGPFSGDWVTDVHGTEVIIGWSFDEDNRLTHHSYTWCNPYGGDTLILLYKGSNR